MAITNTDRFKILEAVGSAAGWMQVDVDTTGLVLTVSGGVITNPTDLFPLIGDIAAGINDNDVNRLSRLKTDAFDELVALYAGVAFTVWFDLDSAVNNVALKDSRHFAYIDKVMSVYAIEYSVPAPVLRIKYALDKLLRLNTTYRRVSSTDEYHANLLQFVMTDMLDYINKEYESYNQISFQKWWNEFTIIPIVVGIA